MKKIFSLVALVGVFMLMSFSLESNIIKADDLVYPDCFAAANQAERIACGKPHCNDALWDFMYDFCLYNLY